ncbi:MAG: hypothetical protein ACREV8_04055, partial [Gammaproteobacteria bacterium]
MIAKSVAGILDNHVRLPVEAIDRMYLNVFVPGLQYEQPLAARHHREDDARELVGDGDGDEARRLSRQKRGDPIAQGPFPLGEGGKQRCRPSAIAYRDCSAHNQQPSYVLLCIVMYCYVLVALLG